MIDEQRLTPMPAARLARLLIMVLITALGAGLVAGAPVQAQSEPVVRTIDCDRARTVCFAERLGDWKVKDGRKSTPRSILRLNDIDASRVDYRRTRDRFSVSWKVKDLRPREESAEGAEGDYYVSDQYYEVFIRFNSRQWFKAQYITGLDYTYRTAASYRFSGRCKVKVRADYADETVLLRMPAGCLPKAAHGTRRTVKVLSSSSVKHYGAPRSAPFAWYPSVDRSSRRVLLP